MAGSPAPPTGPWRPLSAPGLQYMVASIVCFVLAVLFVALRVIGRLRQFGRLFTDDYLIIAALVPACGLMVEAILFAENGGIGWPILTLPLMQVEYFFKVFYALVLTYIVCIPLVKGSILVLYYRIFGDVKWFRISLYITAALVAMWTISIGILAIRPCDPIAKYWNSALPGECVNSQQYYWANGISNLLIDAIILALPLPLIWKLHLGVWRKLALSGIFLLGSFVCVCAILRIATIGILSQIDITKSVAPTATWSIVEPCMGIVGACLPTLRPLFGKMKNAASRSSNNQRREYSSGAKSPFHVSIRKPGVSSNSKSSMGYALTNWNETSNYTEIKGTGTPEASTPRDIERDASVDNNFSVNPPPASHQGSVEDPSKSILVTREFSIRQD